MKSISVNGTRINYLETGREGAPVVLMAHSLATSRDQWEPQIAALADRYRVIAYDHRGHGRSEAPSGAYSIPTLAGDAVALIRSVVVGPVAFVGLSMGGMVGQYLGIHHAELLKGLVLCSTTSRVPPAAQPMWAERIEAVRSGGMNTQTEATLARWFTKPFLAKAGPEIEKTRAMIEATPAAGYIGCCEAIRHLNLTDQLRSVTLPTRVIVGRDDPSTDVAAATVIKDAIVGADLCVIEDASHQCGLEQPAAFNEALLGGLRRIFG